jgi:hypothetical protein
MSMAMVAGGVAELPGDGEHIDPGLEQVTGGRYALIPGPRLICQFGRTADYKLVTTPKAGLRRAAEASDCVLFGEAGTAANGDVMTHECAHGSSNQLQQQHTNRELRRHHGPCPVTKGEGRQEVEQEPRYE